MNKHPSPGYNFPVPCLHTNRALLLFFLSTAFRCFRRLPPWPPLCIRWSPSLSLAHLGHAKTPSICPSPSFTTTSLHSPSAPISVDLSTDCTHITRNKMEKTSVALCHTKLSTNPNTTCHKPNHARNYQGHAWTDRDPLESSELPGKQTHPFPLSSCSSV